MEYALTADHHRVHAFDAEKGQEYYCPVCGNQVIPRQGEVNSWHFAHVTSCMDDWKYDMSEWHRGWQSRFPENVREIVVEHRGECHRADILMGGYVIEFQHSPISAGEFERRNKFYTRAGYKVIWVFDETYAFGNEYISSSLDDENKFVWKWPNRVLASVVPQRSTDIAVVLQLTEDHDDDGCEWLVKVEWAIVDDDGYADYRRFFIDDGFAPDLFTEDGLQNILLSKRKRFDAFLRDNQPYAPKCSRIKGNPRDWYIRLGERMKKRSGCVKNEKDLSSEDLSILVQHRMLLGLWSQPVLRKRSWMRNISGSARAMTRPLMNGQWIATIGDGSCVRFAAELSRMRRCPITVAREVQTGESVPIVHEMVVANPHSWLDIIRMMVYY